MEEEAEKRQGEQDIEKNEYGLEAYNILLQRHINEDRVRSERTSVFLASNSILYLGFVMSLDKGVVYLSIALCMFGVMISLLTLPSVVYQ